MECFDAFQPQILPLFHPPPLLTAALLPPAHCGPLCFAGGFFDGKTSSEERQRYLLDTIRTSTQQQAAQQAQQAGNGGGGGDAGGASADGPMSDAQLNRLLARGDEELELFEDEDRRVQVGGWLACQAAFVQLHAQSAAGVS
jgi:hypothetical protein